MSMDPVVPHNCGDALVENIHRGSNWCFCPCVKLNKRDSQGYSDFLKELYVEFDFEAAQ
jgi:hypothetical protein